MKNGPIKCALISLTPRAIVVNHTRILHGTAGRSRVCSGVKFRADGALRWLLMHVVLEGLWISA